MSWRNKVEGVRQIWHFDNRWPLLLSRLWPTPAPSIYRVGRLRILVDHAAGDANGTREVFATPMYRDLLDLMDLAGPLRVLDVGAHTGGFTLLLASRGLNLQRALCVELNPNTFVRLQVNLEANLPGVAHARCAAVGGQAGDVAVSLGAGGTGDSVHGGAVRDEATREYHIEGVTLDALCRDGFGHDAIDLCKIDIEGAEHDVFATEHHTDLARCRYLIIELHDVPGRDTSAVLQAIARLGFIPLPEPRHPHAAVRGFRNRALTTDLMRPA